MRLRALCAQAGLLTQMSRDKVGGVLNGLDREGLLLVHIDVELGLKRHDQLDALRGLSTQIENEIRAGLDIARVQTQDGGRSP